MRIVRVPSHINWEKIQLLIRLMFDPQRNARMWVNRGCFEPANHVIAEELVSLTGSRIVEIVILEDDPLGYSSARETWSHELVPVHIVFRGYVKGIYVLPNTRWESILATVKSTVTPPPFAGVFRP